MALISLKGWGESMPGASGAAADGSGRRVAPGSRVTAGQPGAFTRPVSVRGLGQISDGAPCGALCLF